MRRGLAVRQNSKQLRWEQKPDTVRGVSHGDTRKVPGISHKILGVSQGKTKQI